jgi:hypothetical protein
MAPGTPWRPPEPKTLPEVFNEVKDALEVDLWGAKNHVALEELVNQALEIIRTSVTMTECRKSALRHSIGRAQHFRKHFLNGFSIPEAS